ncbi:MAG: WXG100 family type VII secretion target [Nocardiopsaceae bacterium]|jgi:WXG100 family type VII secretion target|nr:WXG100 family type VII secretion target [Nocardiopsaceae bacterium]
MSDFQKVDFGALQQGAEDFASIYAQLTATHEELDQQLQSSLALWDGPARQAYQVANGVCQQARAHMLEILNAMPGAISDINTMSQSTEAGIAQMWS